tara:strand:- start:1270 stop:1701 length:432 start_codon:yes stop_codon:yes gene_type:complete
MDLQLKFLEDNFLYEIDDWFFSQLRKFSVNEATVIIGQVLSIIDELPDRNGWSQSVAGVIKKKNPTFFVVEYLKQKNDIPILVDIEEIEVDEYLDYILEAKSIKSYLNAKSIKSITDIILEGGRVLSPKTDNKDNLGSRGQEE